MTATRLRRFVACVVLAAGATASVAMWVDTSEPVPVERLVANLTRRVEKEPDNAQAHYALGRVHSLAYAIAAKTVRVDKPHEAYESKSEGGAATGDKADPVAWIERWVPAVFDRSSVRVKRPPGELTDERVAHFGKAVLHLRRAAELDPKNALARLGVAWLLEDGNDLAPRLGWPDGVERKYDLSDAERADATKGAKTLADGGADLEGAYSVLRKLGVRAMPLVVPLRSHESKDVRDVVAGLLKMCWRDLAFAAYVDAFRVAFAEDVKVTMFDMDLPPPTTTEAGEAVLRLLKDREETDATRKLRDEVTDALKRIAAIQRYVTPVLFPTRPDATLADLVPPKRTALFDLDGDDVAERWPWPTADAAILVWRPDPAVRVTSGRQLFGSRTWWIFWKNGYEPLAALDDDGDGRLTGRELDGICVWRDRNGDAVEDLGEVVTAAEFGVVAIETSPRGRQEGVPAHPRGVTLADGSTRATYDWTPRRAEAAPAASQ